MHSTRIHRALMPLLLASLLPLAAQAANTKEGSIDREISADLASARNEVRAELATAAA